MKLKNTTFKIFDEEYRLLYVDAIESENEDTFYWGIADSSIKEIRIATKDKEGNQIKDNQIKNSLYHELLHAIFSEGCYIDCNNNEPLVEWTAKCLTSLSKQGVI